VTRPPTPSADEAQRLFDSGDLAGVQRECLTILAGDPDDAEAHHLLARTSTFAGQPLLAIGLCERAIAARPTDPHYRVSLATALRAAGDSAGAADQLAVARSYGIDALDRAMEAGMLALAVGDAPGAVEDFERAAGLDPDEVYAQIGLVLAHTAVGDERFARAGMDAARALTPDADTVPSTWARTLGGLGRVEDGVLFLRLAEKAGFDDPELPHTMAALTGDRSVSRASDEWVTSHFDRFAADFDKRLRGRLEYRVPEVLEGLLRAALPADARPLDVVDGGCGTGLCGPLLRPFASTLIGIDLSPRMLERARQTGAYDELVVGELVAGLRARPASCDVVVMADVLIYFGDLDELLDAAAVALRPGGMVVWSAERNEGDSWTLERTGRYAHSAGYLRVAAARAGLEVAHIDECTCRLEKRAPVAAYVGIFQRPA
jgi:predicted TPR repeat methyltransferase